MQPSDPGRRTSSRELVSRIDRGYYTRPGRMRAWRGGLTAAGVLLAAAWGAWGLVDQPRHHAPGPVVAAHARFERDCQACHIPFAPIKDDTVLATGLSRAAADAKCEACHRTPVHHPRQSLVEAGSCSSCHVDHRGRDADIARVADRTCVACHADIDAHRLPPTAVAAGGPRPAAPTPITRFDDEHHPPFASLGHDPGRLKFSHGRHMTAGLEFGGPSRAGPLSYAMLDDADRARLMPAGASAGDPVQLSCAACHEFAPAAAADEARLTTTLLAASPPGAYPLPVSFERHCVACHALPFDPADPARRLPHGLGPEQMQRRIVADLLEATAAGKRAIDAPLPPRGLPANPPLPSVPETIRTQLAEGVARARTFTRGVCGKCHEAVDAPIPVAALLRGDDPPAGVDATEIWFRVPATGVPDVWLAKARFSHAPHRGTDCRACHDAAYPAADGAAASASALDNHRVMIAGRESCTGCHAPPGRDAAGRLTGGAPFDCVECHGYHGLGRHGPVHAALSRDDPGDLLFPAAGPGPAAARGRP